MSKKPTEYQMLVLFTILVGAAIMLFFIVPIFWRYI